MTYSFSDRHAEHASTRQGPAAGIDREAVHRIRRQGRIERAKLVRRCFALLKRRATALKHSVTAPHFGGGLS